MTSRAGTGRAQEARKRNQAGQVTLFIIGLATVVLFTIVTVIDASAAFLQRQALSSLAESAALQGADQGADLIYLQGVPEEALKQSEAAVVTAVQNYLARSGVRAKFPGLQVHASVNQTNNTVTVSVRAPLDVPLRIPGITDGMMVGSQATAQGRVLN